MDVNDLPPENLRKIFSYLTFREKFVCERVCRRWQQNVFGTIDKLSCIEITGSWNGQYIKNIHWEFILSKCGQNLHSFHGGVTRPMVVAIAKYCKRLHSIDVEFEDFECLQLLCERFGRELKWATVCSPVPHAIKLILESCPKLVSLTVKSNVCCWSESTDGAKDDSYSVQPYSLSSLRNLVLKSRLTSEILKGIALLTQLKKVNITIRESIVDIGMWTSTVKRWACLTSLSLEINVEDYVVLVSLPPHLEYLEIKADWRKYKGITEDYVNYQIPEGSLTFLPKLKSAKIDQSYFNSGFFNSVMQHLAICCPNIEELAAGRFYSEQNMGEFIDKPTRNMDECLMPVLSMCSLKKLSLEVDFRISDTIASKLIADLPCLTSFGSYKNEYHQYFLPAGKAFWKALRCKALSHPSEVFDIIGCVDGILYLNRPLPPNVHLCVKFYAEVNLNNGFGQSCQWQELIDRSWDLITLIIELQDINRNLIGLPKCVDRLTIKCLNYNKGTNNDALTFNTILPELTRLNIFQINMSNTQLGATIECVANCCPKLEILSVARINEEPEPVDGHLERLLECQYLRTFNITNNVVLSDEFAKKLGNEKVGVWRYEHTNIWF